MLSSDDKHSLNFRLKELKKRLEVLVNDYQQLKKSNAEMQGEIRRLRNLSDIQKNTIKDLSITITSTYKNSFLDFILFLSLMEAQ